jgi:hypothetical protein
MRSCLFQLIFQNLVSGVYKHVAGQPGCLCHVLPSNMSVGRNPHAGVTRHQMPRPSLFQRSISLSSMLSDLALRPSAG